jgi:hypothetical protein
MRNAERVVSLGEGVERRTEVENGPTGRCAARREVTGKNEKRKDIHQHDPIIARPA